VRTKRISSKADPVIAADPEDDICHRAAIDISADGW